MHPLRKLTNNTTFGISRACCFLAHRFFALSWIAGKVENLWETGGVVYKFPESIVFKA